MTLKPIVDQRLLEEHAEELYEDAPCGYLSVLEDGTIVKVNQTLLTWLGYQRSELLQGKRFQELLSMGGRIFFETHFAPLLKMQGFANEISFDLVTKNRQTIPVLTSTVRKRSSDGQAAVNRITVFNITDRKKYERELLLERQRAEKAARAKADFLSMMSHEIRTPMNAVIGIANLLERTSLSDQQREYTSMLKTSSENLMNLLNSILDFSKIEAGKIVLEERNFHLENFLHDCVRGLEGKAREKGLRLALNVDEAVPTYLIGDPIKICQVVTNFVGNAIKFTEHGGVDVNVASLGNLGATVSLRFEVCDTGIGISPDRLPRIFDEFTQADYEIGMKYGGTGLGLAISNKLVEMYGSKISVESEVGKGSKFSFDLNLKVGSNVEQPARKVRKTEESGVLTGVHVLIAEDNKENLFILERLLRNWGVSYSAVTNGRDAITKVKEEKFDVVLMDLRMPVMDGYEATNQIREMSDESMKSLPIIAFSASTKIGEEDLVEITAFNDVLGKPFRPEELFSKIAFHSGRHSSSVSPDHSKADGTSAGATPPTPQHFTLETYMNVLDGDEVALKEMLRLIIQSYAEARNEINCALSEGDLAKFEFQAHRIKNSMEMLDAQVLRKALDLGRDVLSQKSLNTEEARVSIESAFSAVIRGLGSVVD